MSFIDIGEMVCIVVALASGGWLVGWVLDEIEWR